MNLLPNHTLGIMNLWWYPLIYGLVTLLVMRRIPKDQKKKILSFPKSVSGLVSFIFGKALIVYSLFIPVNLLTPNFIVGTVVYLIGLVLSVYSMWTFSKADLNRPVTHGIYKASRHPMQVMSFVMWFGISIVSGGWVVIICVLLFAITSCPSLVAQEKYCLDRYGDTYKKYMNTTSRYLGWKSV